jgi:hypothetical protein
MRCLRTIMLAAAAMLGACGGDSNDPVGPGPDPDPTPSPGPGPGSVLQGRAIFGLTCANGLVLFGSGNPGTLVRDVPITGMSAGSVMLGIDFSPAGGALYGVGSDSRVYTIDTLSGAATAVGGSFAPGAGGEHFGISFDANGKLTLQSVESNQQQTLDPAIGAVSSADVELAFGAGDARRREPGSGSEWLLRRDDLRHRDQRERAGDRGAVGRAQDGRRHGLQSLPLLGPRHR